MFTQLDYPYMATVKDKGELVIVERVNIHLRPPRTLVSLSPEATKILLGLLTEKLSTSETAEQSVQSDVCQECGETETEDPNNDGVVVCVFCGTRR